MSPSATLSLAVGSLIATCLAAIGAKALREFSRQKLEGICRRRQAAGRLRDVLKHHDRVALGMETLQVVATAVAVCATSFWIFQGVGDSQFGLPTVLIAALLGGLLLLAAEIWVPWAIVNLWAEPFLYHGWPFWVAGSRAMTPLVLAARFVNALFHRLAGRQIEIRSEESFEEEIRTIVSQGHREGLIEEDAREMIEGVIELGDARVSEIMTPRTDMISMPLPSSWDVAVQFVASVPHSRIPVFNKNRDDVIGVLHAKDLLPELAKPDAADRRPLKEVLREPFFVPETKRVDDLLEEFQLTRNHLAVVLDEYGGVSGLVTIEDVLEEIVGEIEDEYDEEAVEGVTRLDDSTAEVLARVHVDEINQQLNLHLPDDDEFDTIGGFVFHELGHIPTAGEQLVWDNVRITVLQATKRRIERLKIEMLDRVANEK